MTVIVWSKSYWLMSCVSVEQVILVNVMCGASHIGVMLCVSVEQVMLVNVMCECGASHIG